MGMFDFMTGEYEGILTPEQRQQATSMGLLQAGAALLQAGGPSTQKTSFGQALGHGLQAMMQGQQSGINSALQSKFLGQKIKASDLEAQLNELALTKSKKDQAALEALRNDPEFQNMSPQQQATRLFQEGLVDVNKYMEWAMDDDFDQSDYKEFNDNGKRVLLHIQEGLKRGLPLWKDPTYKGVNDKVISIGDGGEVSTVYDDSQGVKDPTAYRSTADSVQLNQDFEFPGGVIPKGTAFDASFNKDNLMYETTVPGPDGEPVTLQIPAAIVAKVTRTGDAALTDTQYGRLQTEQRGLETSLNWVDELLENIEREGMATGAVGEVEGFLQGTYDQVLTAAERIPIAQDLMEFVEGTKNFAGAPGDMSRYLTETPEDEAFVADLQSRLWDTNLPTSDILSYAITVALASSMFSDQRIPVETLRTLHAQASVGGFFGPGRATASVKLRRIKEMIGERIESNKTLMHRARRPTIQYNYGDSTDFYNMFGLEPPPE